jgi:hypothetical protein
MLLRVIADPFLARISILVAGSGTAYHTELLISEAQFFVQDLSFVTGR